MANIAPDPLAGHVSGHRLACLARHWAWADGARSRLDRALADGWDVEQDPAGDHLFEAYYQWCALLCALIEAVLDGELVSSDQLETVRSDVELVLPTLRRCRDVLLVIPATREERPRVGDLLRDDGSTLERIRRIHGLFGATVAKEQRSRIADVIAS